MLRPLRSSNRAFRALTDVPKICDGDSLPVGFGFLHNAFADDMIGVLAKSGFTTREFLAMPFRGFGAALLQALTKGRHPLTVFLDGFTAEGFTFGVGGKVDDCKFARKRQGFFANDVACISYSHEIKGEERQQGR